MKRSLVYSIILILISTCAIAGNFVIHDMTTGIMHEAKDISNTPAGNVSSVKVQTAINELDTEKVDKSGSITQITTRNHDDLQNVTGNGTVHLSASEKTNHDTAYTHSQNTTTAHGLTISDVPKKSGDLSQFTGTNLTQIGTRSHTSLTDIGTNTHAQVDSHIANNTNPHGLTISNLALKSGNLSQFSGGYSFKNLSDTPQTYAGKGGFYLRLSTDETQLILDTPGVAPDETVKADSGDLTSGYLNDKITGSISLDAVNHKLQLDGDIGAPGNYKFYGTNGSGIKSFYQIDHTTLSNIGTNTHAQIDTHIANTSAAHGLTINDVALKSGSLSQFTTRSAGDLSSGTLDNARLSSNVPLKDGTNTFSGNCTFNNIISGNINGNSSTATNATTHINNTIGAHNVTAITNGADKTGSLSQFATRNASDINVDTSAFGNGLSTSETTVQKVADRVNINGVAPFVTDKSKCSLLLDFKDGLTDKTRGINSVGYELANRWSNNFINDSTSEASATNISCTLKQFDGDEGKFGSGVAVEESRTNLFLYSQTTSNASWQTPNTTKVSGIQSPVGNDGLYVNRTSADGYVAKRVAVTSGTQYTISFWAKATVNGLTFTGYLSGGSFSGSLTTNWKRYYFTTTAANANELLEIYATYSIGYSFYLDGVQIEAGAFPTSYIATGATAVTRPAGKLRFAHLINTGSDFSISAWYQFNSNSTIITPTPHLFEITDGTKRLNIYYDVSSQKIISYVFDGSTFISQGVNFTFNSNEKYNFSLKVASGILYVYCNKTLLYSFDMSLYKFETFYLDLGCRATATDAFLNGTISNFQVYNYALSDTEISNIYYAGLEGKPVVCSNPVNHQDIVREYAGTPNGNIMPMFFGESVYDTTNNVWYKSKKIDNSTFVNPAWLQLN